MNDAEIQALQLALVSLGAWASFAGFVFGLIVRPILEDVAFVLYRLVRRALWRVRR